MDEYIKKIKDWLKYTEIKFTSVLNTISCVMLFIGFVLSCDLGIAFIATSCYLSLWAICCQVE